MEYPYVCRGTTTQDRYWQSNAVDTRSKPVRLGTSIESLRCHARCWDEDVAEREGKVEMMNWMEMGIISCELLKKKWTKMKMKMKM